MRVAVCPGSFDPVTHGHLDIIARASALFDKVVVAVGKNSTKNSLFSANERGAMLTESLTQWANVEVDYIDGLLVDFCARHEATAIVKGLRFAKDFDYELQMAQMNRKLSGIETIMLPTAAQWSYVSSTMIREIALAGGDISEFVPDVVMSRLHQRRGQETKED